MIYPVNGKYLCQADFQLMKAKVIVFCVTQNCDLNCKYCFLHKKDGNGDMSWGMAKRIIDFMFENPHQFFDDPNDELNKFKAINDKTRALAKYLVFDFTGGEPLQRIELVERICAYILKKAFQIDLEIPIKFALTTNGMNFLQPQVQDFVKKYKKILALTISIDGNERMHNSCRTLPDGSGSYKIVRKSVDKFVEQFQHQDVFDTKVTVSPDNLPYLAEGLIHLWAACKLNLIVANVVLEDVWEEKHTIIFKRELVKIKNFLLKSKNYLKYYTTLFDETIGQPIKSDDVKLSCGEARSIITWNSKGDFFNCIRFTPSACKNREGYKVGSIDEGWIDERSKQLCMINRRTTSTDECFYCKVASGCNYCLGAQYDCFGDLNQRATFICGMHKVRVEVSKEYFKSVKFKTKRRKLVSEIEFVEWEDFNQFDNFTRIFHLIEQKVITLSVLVDKEHKKLLNSELLELKQKEFILINSFLGKYSKVLSKRYSKILFELRAFQSET